MSEVDTPALAGHEPEPEAPKQTKYRVSGTQPFLGHKPGETFEAELDEAQKARAIARGSIKVAGGKGGGKKSALNDAPTGQKKE